MHIGLAILIVLGLGLLRFGLPLIIVMAFGALQARRLGLES